MRVLVAVVAALCLLVSSTTTAAPCTSHNNECDACVRANCMWFLGNGGARASLVAKLPSLNMPVGGKDSTGLCLDLTDVETVLGSLDSLTKPSDWTVNPSQCPSSSRFAGLRLN